MDGQNATTQSNFATDDESPLSSLASGLKETGRVAGEAVKQQARQFAAGVGDELQRTGEDQKIRGVEVLRSLARAIETAAELARARPAVFIGGSVAAGFAFARFLKSSAASAGAPHSENLPLEP